MARSIAVAGKGGTGKSTIAAFIVLELVRRKETPVLAIDADPDANLGTHLGIDVEQSIGDLREDMMKQMQDFPPGMSKAQYMEAGFHGIIEEVEGFDLITMGRGEGSGCYCYLNSMIRKFSEDIVPSYRWVVMDNEAGLEHISRRTTSNIDALVIVVNDNPISLNTARNIEEITKDLKTAIKKKYVMTNMVKEKRRDDVKNKIQDLGLARFCDIPFDETIEEAVYAGKSLREAGSEVIRSCIASLVDEVSAL